MKAEIPPWPREGSVTAINTATFPTEAFVMKFFEPFRTQLPFSRTAVRIASRSAEAVVLIALILPPLPPPSCRPHSSPCHPEPFDFAQDKLREGSRFFLT